MMRSVALHVAAMVPCAALCLLSGCATDTEATLPAAVCSVQKTAEIPLSVEHGHITAAALIDNKPVTMLVDTGAERTVVTPDAVAALRLQRDPHAMTNVVGTGGTTSSRNARLQSFGIGGMEMLDQSYAVTALPTTSLVDYNASGALGADWLRAYDVDLDLPHRRMALYTVQDCTGDVAPWQGERTKLPVYQYGAGLLLVPFTLDGVRLTAILDSGADHSVVSEAAAARTGLDPATLARDPHGSGTGVDGSTRVVHLHSFASLAVGTDRVTAPRLMVDPLHLPAGASMLLGLDWLATHRVWIDYAASTIAIQSDVAGASP